jgi:hypothetical protein
MTPLPSTKALSQYIDSLWHFACSTPDDGEPSVFRSMLEPTETLSQYIITIGRTLKYTRTALLVALELVGRY